MTNARICSSLLLVLILRFCREGRYATTAWARREFPDSRVNIWQWSSFGRKRRQLAVYKRIQHMFNACVCVSRLKSPQNLCKYGQLTCIYAHICEFDTQQLGNQFCYAVSLAVVNCTKAAAGEFEIEPLHLCVSPIS